MSLSFEEKNQNILNRFESNITGTKVRKFTFKLDGRSVTMIDVNNASLTDAKDSLYSRFGLARISDIHAH
tara:strand:- start:618 stop:827 length:210 start_codon:yes stop_codon:yes gene_type:complete